MSKVVRPPKAVMTSPARGAMLPRVSVRVVFTGPEKVGKTMAVKNLYSRIRPALGPSKLVSINSFDGSTLLFDYFHLPLGIVDDQEVSFQVYSAPGNPHYNLAARMIANAADVLVFVTDCRDGFMPHTMRGLKDLKSVLEGSARHFDHFPIVIQLNKMDALSCRRTDAMVFNRLRPLKKPIIFTSALSGDGLDRVLKTATELALKNRGDRPSKTALPAGSVSVDEDYVREVAAANEIYLRTFSSVTTSYSPHSESFLGAILEKYGLVSPTQLKRAMDIQNKTFDEDDDVTLDRVLVMENMVSEEEVERAMRLKCISEIIHEEVLYGKIAVENDFAAFSDVKECLLFQKEHSFLYSLGHLLHDMGRIDVRRHTAILEELSVIHRTESERHTRVVGGRKTSAFVTPVSFEGEKRSEFHFGDLAVKNKFITQRQLDECLALQRELKGKGIEKYLGVILQEKGYVTNREVELICSTQEAELAKNPIEGYKIEAQLGRGNMGLVYAAKQIKLDRIVALKVLDPKLAMDKEFIQRFYEEARVGAQLNHPNIVQFYDVGESGGYHYISMEYVEGLTVKEIVDRDRLIEEVWSLDIIKQIVKALFHAKSTNLIHLDIKPGNIMINDQGIAKLCDLGLAKQTDRVDNDLPSSLIVGSPFYISPEQIERVPELDERADIYGLGATLFHMLTGKPPFTGRNAEEIFLKHLTHRVPDIMDINPKLNPEIGPLIKKMMAKDRNERLQGHGDLLTALKRLTGEKEEDLKGRGIGGFFSTFLRRRSDEE